jgi:hypothetical protein
MGCRQSTVGWGMLWFETMRHVIKCTCRAFRDTADATNTNAAVISDTVQRKTGPDNDLQ